MQEDEDVSSPAHTYSKIDKSKKKRAAAPPPPLPPPHHPVGPSPAARPVSFNVDDMYAKVQKSPPPRPVSEDPMLSMGAIALVGGSPTMRTTRVRSAPWDPAIDETSRRSQVGLCLVLTSDFNLSSSLVKAWKKILLYLISLIKNILYIHYKFCPITSCCLF